jgi:transcriptional regulator with XRE-family HTH domain
MMKLKELRVKKGVTQNEVAIAVGCAKSTYPKYEREEREPDITTLCRLADYFEVTVDYLIDHKYNDNSILVDR